MANFSIMSVQYILAFISIFLGQNQFNKAIFIVFLALTGALGRLELSRAFNCHHFSHLSLSWSLKSFSAFTQIYPNLNPVMDMCVPM